MTSEEYKDTIEKLNDRAKKLAMEKSYQQLIIHMMKNLNLALDMDEAVIAIPRIILNNIGGTNVLLYYIDDKHYFLVDAYGKKNKIDTIEDQEIKEVFDTKKPNIIEKAFEDTMMTTPEFTQGRTYIYPLIFGSNLIGMLKIENSLNISTAFWEKELPMFFGYVALLLRNMMLSHTRLQDAYKELELQNAKLENFNAILVNREMRVVEVKVEVNTLCKELGRIPTYKKIDEEILKDKTRED